MLYLIHTEKGYIHEVLQTSQGSPPAPFGHSVLPLEIEKAELPSISSNYVESGEIKPSTFITSLKADKTYILADGVSSCIISGLPEDGCELQINNKVIDIPIGTVLYTITSIEEQVLAIKLVGKYISDTLFIEVTTLDKIKEEFYSKLRTKREEVQTAGCKTDFGYIDTDYDSLVKLQLTAQVASLSDDTFNVNWTMKNNNTYNLTKQDIISALLKVTTFLNGTQSNKLRLQSLIRQATDIEMLYSVDLTEGWPT